MLVLRDSLFAVGLRRVILIQTLLEVVLGFGIVEDTQSIILTLRTPFKFELNLKVKLPAH